MPPAGNTWSYFNNDAVVTDLWLDQLIALTRARAEVEVGEASGPDSGGDPSGARRPSPSAMRAGTIGLIGPMSN
jgi:hypothetical protein